MKKTSLIGKIISVLFKTLALALVLVLLAPVIYFAWRAGQPMCMPEYDGRTYYELLVERRQAYADSADNYQASHPGAEVKQGMCFKNEAIVLIGYTLPWAGFCALSERIPAIGEYVGPRARKAGCGYGEDKNWSSFMDLWWMNFVRMQQSIYDHRIVGPVAYCQIPAP